MKLDPSGAVLWAKQTKGSAEPLPTDIAIGPNGEMMVTGYYANGTLEFEGRPPLASTSANAPFITRFRKDGAVDWSRSWAASIDATAFGVAPSADGSFIVVGANSGQVDFDGHVVGVGGRGVSPRAFVVRIGTSGQVMWAAEALPTNEESGVVGFRAVATDAQGRAYAVGSFGGSTGVFRSATPTSAADVSIDALSANDMIIASYDPNGVVRWARRAGGPNVPLAQTIAMDVASDGTDIYVVGSIHGPGARRFEPLELTTTGVLFVARYDSDGNARDVLGVGGTNSSDDGEAHGIAVVKGKGISVAGTLSRTWQFGTLPPITATGLTTLLPVAAHACE